MPLPCFVEIHAFNANSVEPDQMPRSVTSALGLHCLPMSYGTLGIRGLSKKHTSVRTLCP